MKDLYYSQSLTYSKTNNALIREADIKNNNYSKFRIYRNFMDTLGIPMDTHRRHIAPSLHLFCFVVVTFKKITVCALNQ